MHDLFFDGRYRISEANQSRYCLVLDQSPSSDNDDPIEKILRQREREREVAINSVTQSSQEFRQILDEFWNQPRVERTVDILKYWQEKKFESPLLFSTSEICLALPVTQVSCERSFSGLKYVLSDLRSNLNLAVLKDIPFIRANAKFEKIL